MCTFTHNDRQSIVNRIYIHFIAQRNLSAAFGATERSDLYQSQVKSAMGIFDSALLDGIAGIGIADKNANCPEAVASVFNARDKRRLDNDDVAFLIDLEAEHSLAVMSAVPYQGFSDPRRFDAYFRREMGKRLNRFAINEGLRRPASALSASCP